jgi:hypothetical protein
MCERNIEVHSPIYWCSGKAISITYSACVSVAFVIQHALRMRRIIRALPSVANNSSHMLVVNFRNGGLRLPAF